MISKLANQSLIESFNYYMFLLAEFKTLNPYF
ncbi:hypothetical protein Mucpa_2566 [Mucilaginibacter paludis DSM 18603]|uniref:Uncharacterized protein n=1 Tax=Mucilaginibacter paludis DSM 18603 TaxID=714943 RepID=H1Y224_9SPHI|nr:hypothetical protein Mucpa_2566 [Mucilaginibacter paludis DSM 18603]